MVGACYSLDCGQGDITRTGSSPRARSLDVVPRFALMKTEGMAEALISSSIAFMMLLWSPSVASLLAELRSHSVSHAMSQHLYTSLENTAL